MRNPSENRVFLAFSTVVVAACCSPTPSGVTIAPVSATSHHRGPLAIDDRYDDLGCEVFAKDGVAENGTALRRCLARTATANACASGSAPDLATLELAVALIDGIGGAADVARARRLLARCPSDAAVKAVLEHATAKEKDPNASPLESCDTYAQTTLTSTDCATERLQGERAWIVRSRHDVGPKARALFDAAEQAHEAYAKTLGEIEYQRWASSPLRSAAMSDKIRAVLHERRARLARLRSFAPLGVSSADVAAAREALQRSYRAAHDAQPDAAAAVEASDRAYLVYRDAEASLYESLHPGARAPITVTLDRVHAAHLCASLPP